MSKVLTTEEKFKESVEFRDEVMELFRRACRDVTEEHYEIISQKLDFLSRKIDLFLERQERLMSENYKRQTPKKIIS